MKDNVIFLSASNLSTLKLFLRLCVRRFVERQCALTERESKDTAVDRAAIMDGGRKKGRRDKNRQT